MKRTLLALAVLFFAVLLTTAAEPRTAHARTPLEAKQRSAQAPATAGQDVLGFEQARREAVVRVDVPALDAMSAAALIYVDAHGSQRNKTEYLEHIAMEHVHYNSYSLSDTAVKVFGELAVATGRFDFDVTVNGRNNRGAQYYTAIYIRTAGRWQLLIWHPTTAP